MASNAVKNYKVVWLICKALSTGPPECLASFLHWQELTRVLRSSARQCIAVSEGVQTAFGNRAFGCAGLEIWKSVTGRHSHCNVDLSYLLQVSVGEVFMRTIVLQITIT